MGKYIEYVEVSKDQFNTLINVAEENNIYMKFGGGFMGCQFLYGHANIYKKHNHIIAMINHESGTYNLETKFHKDVLELL